MKALALLPFLLLAGMSHGQETDHQETLSLDKAVNIALEQNYLLENARLDIEKASKMRKSSFDLPPPELYLELGQINSDLHDRYLSVNQSFRFPTTYASQGKLNRAMENLEEEKFFMTKSELVASVMSVYSRWILHHEQLKLVRWVDSIYSDFISAAETLFNAGEINGMEMIMAETKAASIMKLFQEVNTDFMLAENDLKALLNTDVYLQPGEQQMIRLEISVRDDSLTLEDNPYISYIRQYLEVQHAIVKNESSQYLPDFSIGYFNQSIDRVNGFDGIQLGMNFPLWFWSRSARVKAARIEQHKAENQLNAEIRQTQLEIEKLLVQLDRYAYMLSYYESTALQQANTILGHSLKAFETGDISYIEYANATSGAFEIRMDYLRAINNYNQTVININYLIGSYQH